MRASRVVQEANHQLKLVGPIAILANNNVYIDKPIYHPILMKIDQMPSNVELGLQ